MFRENIEHLQKDLFGLFQSMPADLQKKAEKSQERQFYELLFCNIDEQIFSVLYSNEPSRPNRAVNSMVAALILREKRRWTYCELLENIQFNLLTRLALGLDDFESMPFCETTLFNFQCRLAAHFLDTGQDLFEQVFDSLTAKQLKALGIKTDIQRTDSFMVESNICEYSRIRLLVEVVIRFHRILSDSDKAKFGDYFSAYIKESANKYVYKLDKGDLTHELEKLAELFQMMVKRFRSGYKDTAVYQMVKRVFQEHFTVAHKKVHVKPNEALTSSCLQSPDDMEATYRYKNGDHRGRVVNVTETAHPDNTVNLITDVAVNPNNTDDGAALNKRLDRIKEKTPDLNEMHTDGAYGSPDNDKKYAELHITPIQTAVRGRQTNVRFDIEQIDENSYIVHCPQQQQKSQLTRTRHKACFDLKLCIACDLRAVCPTQAGKKCRTFYFTHGDYLRSKRVNMIYKIPQERRKIRPNVEATVREFKSRTENGKLRVRGTFQTRLFAFSTAIAVNFGRIVRYENRQAALQTA